MKSLFDEVFFIRTADQIYPNDYDEYGFALKLIEKKCGEMTIEFYTKDPTKNIVARNQSIVIPSSNDPAVPSNFVVFHILAAFASASELQKLDIVETIKYLLTNSPVSCDDTLQNMPSYLYENKKVALDIFSCIPNNCGALQKAEKAIRSKFKVMKEYYDLMESKKQSPEQLHQKIEEAYNSGIKSLHNNGGKE